jgi:type IV secretion system protein VirB4
MMLGKTGSGKTTLLAACLAMITKYRPRMWIYDKDQGLFPLVKALGGEYTILQEGVPSGWQPLQMEPTNRNIAFVKRLVRMLAEVSNNGPLHPLDAMLLSSAIDNVMGASSLIPRHDRTMSALYDMIPAAKITEDEEGRVPVKMLIQEWTRLGEHGWLFDNPSDSIDLNTRDIHAYDLTEFIVGPDQEPPKTRAPMLLYLLFRVRESIDGSRHVVQVFDEFAQYLDDPTLALEIKRGLKTDRKKDAIYLFATQEPNDALESSIGKTIIQAVVTLVLLYNPEALPSDYINGLKLTEAEYQRMLDIPENSRQFLVKQGGQSALAHFDLSGMDDAISILSGTPDNSELLRKIIENVGEDPDVWLPLYYDAVKRGKLS